MLGALGIAVVLLLCGCGSEPFIESYAPSWSYVVGTAAPALELRQEPGGILRNSDVYAAANGKPLSSPPAAIVPFREALLLLLAEESALELLERTSFRSRARIPLPSPPRAIAFPNATTAVTSHPELGALQLLDLVALRPAAMLALGGHPTALLAVGPLLYVADSSGKRLLCVDLRRMAIADSTTLPAPPRFVGLRADSSELLVLCAGSGDAPSLGAQAPMLLFLRRTPLQQLSALRLYPSAADSATVRLSGLAVTSGDFAWIGTSGGLLRVDIRTRGSVRVFNRWDIRQLVYVRGAEQLWLLHRADRWYVTLSSATRAEPQSQTEFPYTVTAVAPLP